MYNFFHFSKIHQKFFAKNGEKIKYKKGQYLVWKEDNCPWVFFSEEGIVSTNFNYKDGTNRLIGYLLPGMTYAQSGSFFDDDGGKIEYIAETPTTVYRVEKQIFLKQLQKDNKFCFEYLQMNLKNQIYLINRIIYQGEKGIEAKLSHWLVFMNKYYGTKISTQKSIIKIPLTQNDIANFLHATRESINPILLKFIDQKLIKIEKKQITILKLNKIKSFYKH